jgi:hypothetical protein
MPKPSPDVENQGSNAGQCHISVCIIRRKFMSCIQSGTRRRKSSQDIIYLICMSRTFGPNTTNKILIVRFTVTNRRNCAFLTCNLIAPKYGDTSATYWKLYGSEAEIYDENLVDSLKGNTGSMVFLVSGGRTWAISRLHYVAYDHLVEHFVLCHRRRIHHRDIQDAPPQQ